MSWLYFPDLFNRFYQEQSVYQILFEECQPYFEQGTVRNGQYDERRLTCYFSLNKTPMTYSGRTIAPTLPPNFLSLLLEEINSYEFRDKMTDFNPTLDVEFNAVFVNWYRPLNQTEKPDKLGMHSDDMTTAKSNIILSATFCQNDGIRVFNFHQNDKIVESIDLIDGSGLYMLANCQKLYKHSINDRKKNLAGQEIKGGRINLTFRSIRDF